MRIEPVGRALTTSGVLHLPPAAMDRTEVYGFQLRHDAVVFDIANGERECLALRIDDKQQFTILLAYSKVRSAGGKPLCQNIGDDDRAWGDTLR